MTDIPPPTSTPTESLFLTALSKQSVDIVEIQYVINLFPGLQEVHSHKGVIVGCVQNC